MHAPSPRWNATLAACAVGNDVLLRLAAAPAVCVDPEAMQYGGPTLLDADKLRVD